MQCNTIIFDLDGTVTDPVQGITRSIRYALDKLERPAPAVADLHWCIGPPLLESFRILLGHNYSDLAGQALTYYRERFSQTGLFENQVYPQIPELLKQLANTKLSVMIATSKPGVYAVDIIDHFGLSAYFARIYGSELSGELVDKSELLGHIIQKESLERSKTVMVGDRSHDIIGAKNNGLASIGVTYGYGSKMELRDCGADWIVDDPISILTVIETSTISN
jgi:phosphoglycolate phosphatase